MFRPREHTIGSYSNSTSRRSLRWLVFGSSTYYLYAFVASILAALIPLLIWNWHYLVSTLAQIGLKHHFVVPGDYNLVLLDQLLANPDMEQIG